MLSYTEVGQGPALVLLHAFPLDHTMWDDVAPALAAYGWRVITPDLRGFGASAGAARSIEEMADDVALLLDTLSEEAVVVGGCSMGGYVAMAFAANHRKRTAGLLCIDTKASADGEDARANRERIATQVLSSGSTEALAVTMPDTLLGATTRATLPEVVASVQERIRAANPEGVAAAQRAMAARPDRTQMLAGLHVPVLALRGAEDVISSEADNALIAESAHDSVTVTIPACGHLPSLEAPGEFVTHVSKFLSRVLRPSC